MCLQLGIADYARKRFKTILFEKRLINCEYTKNNHFLKFKNKFPNNVNGQMLYLQSLDGVYAGQLRILSSVRDTLPHCVI